MSEASKPTPAPAAHWIKWDCVRSAREAEDAFDATGMTPRQLVEQRDALLSALDAAMESGMVPSSSAADGGASKYSAQVRAADQIRAALALVKGGEK